MPAETIPSNWPEGIAYLHHLIYTTAVDTNTQQKLCRLPTDARPGVEIPATMVQVPYPWIEITTICDHSHLAHGQRGLFATQHLPAGSFVCLYLGLVHRNNFSDTDPHSNYDLLLDQSLGLSVDAAVAGNESRFANDYRGVAERPNAEFRDCFVQVRRQDGMRWEKRVAIFVRPARRDGKGGAGIKVGEEILLDYGQEFWEARKRVATFRKDFDMLRIATAALEF